MSHGDWKDMFKAIQTNDEPLVSYYIKNGINIDYQHPEFMTNALCESIRCKRENLVQLLLQHGASTETIEMDSGKTPLEIASEIGYNPVLKIIETQLKHKVIQNQTSNLMKAALCTQYGSAEFLEIQEVPKPSAKGDELLVKIMSTTLNSGDVRVRGLQAEGIMKLIMRLAVGWQKPRRPILGVTFAGIVEAIGKDVTKFNVGDRVFGLTAFKFGCHAEFTIIPEESMVTHLPQNANFDEAAAILFGGQTAVSFLHKMNIQTQKNPKVLILGATGSVGTSSLQIAKYYDANVTAVCGSAYKDLCMSLGADKVIAYDNAEFNGLTEQFDIILDAVGKYTKKQCIHLLAPGGIFKTVGGLEYASESKDQLHILSKIYEEGKLTPVIDKVFLLDDIVKAHTYVDSGRKKGNVVIKIG